MKKSLLTLASILLLTACGGTGSGTTTSDMETIGKAMETGKAMKCEVTPKADAPVAMTMTYYVDGDNIRVESNMNGQAHVAIQKGKDTYVEPEQMMGETECDWIIVTDEEEEADEVETADFDYKKYEADPMYDMICTFGSVSSDMFVTTGKTCTTEDMMQEMMGGMGIDLEGIDMENFQ